jgi:hypothetical protein
VVDLLGAGCGGNSVRIGGKATSVGGVMLALGSFPLVGMFCLVTAALAAGVIRGKVHRVVASPLPLSPS